jgi:hypothetical protein
MHLSFSNVGDETLIGGFNIDQRESVVGQSDHILNIYRKTVLEF